MHRNSTIFSIGLKCVGASGSTEFVFLFNVKDKTRMNSANNNNNITSTQLSGPICIRCNCWGFVPCRGDLRYCVTCGHHAHHNI